MVPDHAYLEGVSTAEKTHRGSRQEQTENTVTITESHSWWRRIFCHDKDFRLEQGGQLFVKLALLSYFGG